jgi:DNA polymerase (family X)
MNRMVKKADVARAIAAARGAMQPRFAPLLPAEDAVTELSRVPGLGPARARNLYDELGICTLQELQAALGDGRVAGLRGFGDAVSCRLQAAVAELLDPRTLLCIADAELHVQRLVAYMQQAPAVQAVDVAGSYRRRCDVIDEIMLLAVSARPAAVTRYFLAYADAATSTSSDPSRASLILQCGLKVELHVVPGRCHGAALHHATGSAEYEAAIRCLGLQRGVRVSDYGVFLLEPGRAGARRVGGQKEEDIYTALGMQWVPPELREDDGEIQAALEQALPPLLRAEDIRGDLRLRTSRSTGSASLEEMLRACRSARYGWCGIVEPVASAAAHALDADALREQAEELAALRPGFPTLQVFHGVEVVLLDDGSLDLPDEEAALAEFVVACPGNRFRGSRTRTTDRLLQALEDPRVDVLACVTGRVVGERSPADADWDVVFQAAARQGVAVELTAEPRRLDPPRELLRAAAAAGTTIVISTGGGSVAEVATMRFGVDQARRGWMDAASVLNSLDAAAVQDWLRQRRR